MRHAAVVLGLGLAILVTSAPVAAGRQQPVAAFRANADLTIIEATVLDRDGTPVRDLGPGDFQVTIAGRPRKVMFADFRGRRTIASASGNSTASPPGFGVEGRTVVFAVDRDSLSSGNEKALLETASTLLDSLDPADAVGLVGIPGAVVDLTRDHARVRAALPLMSGTRPRALLTRDHNITWDEALGYERRDSRVMGEVIERECPLLRDGAQHCPNDLVIQAREMLQAGRAHVQNTTSALEGLAAQLAPLRGSKHIILISGGLPFGQDLLPHFNQFAKKAAEAQLVLYAVHLDQPDSDAGDRRVVSSALGGRSMTDGLGALSGMTGGAFFMGVGRATGVFERITTEINNYYVLGLESEPADAAGASRELKVALSRPGLTVRARRDVASRPAGSATTDPLAALLAQPTDLNELGIGVTAYSTRGDEASTLRVLLAAELSRERARLPADWGFAVLNDGNVVSTGRQRFEAGVSGPLIMTASAKLVPGRYRMRVAVRDADGRAGVTDVPLVVGLRAAGTLQLSDLIVGTAEEGKLQPRARIVKGEAISALIEVMSGDPAQLAAARAVFEVLPAGSAEPVRRILMAARTGSSDAILLNGAEIATAGLEPGRYTASVVATIDGQPVGRVSRTFEIVPAP